LDINKGKRGSKLGGGGRGAVCKQLGLKWGGFQRGLGGILTAFKVQALRIRVWRRREIETLERG